MGQTSPLAKTVTDTINFVSQLTANAAREELVLAIEEVDALRARLLTASKECKHDHGVIYATPDYVARIARAEDRAPAAELINAMDSDLVAAAPDRFRVRGPDYLERYESTTAGNSALLVLLANYEVVGACTMELARTRDVPGLSVVRYASIVDLVVTPALRGTDAADALGFAAVRVAAETGANKLLFCIGEDNRPAQSMAKRFNAVRTVAQYEVTLGNP